MSVALLEVRDLFVSFGGVVAIQGVSMDVESGEIVGLIGPNGAGKTTLLNCVSGVYQATSGTIRLSGRDLSGMKPHQIAAAGIARTFQNVELFGHLTVLQNVLVGLHLRTRTNLLTETLLLPGALKEEQAARERGLDILGFLGLATMASQRAADLPLGHQKLLEFGRALALEPRLLLLDEPSAGMNNPEARALGELIRQAQQRFGFAVLLIEHNMALVMKVSQRIVVLHFGEKIAEGSPHEMQQNPLVVKAYLGEEEPVAGGI